MSHAKTDRPGSQAGVSPPGGCQAAAFPVGVYLPDGRGPGRYEMAELEVVAAGPAALVLPEATVSDERGGGLLGDPAGGGLVWDPAGGGGPLVGAEAARSARAFGLVNTAFHVQRALRWCTRVLGYPLPHLVVRIGMHDQARRWGGGHYRLPGRGALADPEAATPTGEVHLGAGAGFVHSPRVGRYFHAPAHNPAIIYHEVGHHVCRHTADFRLNRLRPPWEQTNKKTALDEGSADVLAAVLLDTPDIYGWHRHRVPESEQRRRKLDPRWTMAYFQGGPGHDPHTDGTVWASACWSARQRIIDSGADPARFDTLFLRGLELAGHHHHTTTGNSDGDGDVDGSGPSEDALRERRHFSRLLAAMTRADPDLAPLVLAAMADHGIHPGLSNNDLSHAARAHHSRQVSA